MRQRAPDHVCLAITLELEAFHLRQFNDHRTGRTGLDDEGELTAKEGARGMRGKKLNDGSLLNALFRTADVALAFISESIQI